MSRNWIAVASAEHVRRGRTEGFMQVCHGKAAPLRRIQSGDVVVYYSPTDKFGSKVALQAFTAIGIVKDGEPFAFDMGNGFCPYRREVQWMTAQETLIRPLLGILEFSSANAKWGYSLRFGLFEITQHDMQIIADAMNAEWL